MWSHDEESPADVADAPDAQQLWRLLVAATGRREQAPSVAIDTFRRLHDAGQPEPVDSALLLCTDWRWRRTSARVLAGILATGILGGQTYYGVPDPELQYRDERTTRLNDLAKPGDHLLYTYDFGDDWDHDITIEEATVAEPGMSYPLCVAGQGACPPEDAGGWPGYARLVQVLTDPGHEEHQDMLDWLGLDNRSQFDPARFARDEANRRLSAVSHAGPIASRH